MNTRNSVYHSEGFFVIRSVTEISLDEIEEKESN